MFAAGHGIGHVQQDRQEGEDRKEDQVGRQKHPRNPPVAKNLLQEGKGQFDNAHDGRKKFIHEGPPSIRRGAACTAPEGDGSLRLFQRFLKVRLRTGHGLINGAFTDDSLRDALD